MNIHAFHWVNGVILATADVPKAGLANKVKAAAADLCNLTVSQLESHDRRERLCLARWMCWQLLRENGWRLQAIADEFGGRDHGSVLHGLRELQDRIGLNKALNNQLAMLRQRVGI